MTHLKKMIAESIDNWGIPKKHPLCGQNEKNCGATIHFRFI